MNLFYQPGIRNGALYLDADESRHVVSVLRMKVGDRLDLSDGQGYFYAAKITDANSKKCAFEIFEYRKIEKRKFQIHVAIAPTKNIDRTEWFVEKAIEIGVDTISFMQCKNSERKIVNIERIEKIAVVAMKQSQQAWLPKLNGMVPFKKICALEASQKFIAHVDAGNPTHLQQVAGKNQDCLILIGPEGDFSEEEIIQAKDNGFVKVSLGANRLRTETAGVAAVHILNLINA